MTLADMQKEFDQRVKINALNDQLNNVSDSTRFVKVIDNGKSYTTHPLADVYRIVNYVQNRAPKNNSVFIIEKEVLINNKPGYILSLYNNGYLISIEGCEKASYSAFLQQALNDFKQILNLKL